MQKGLCKGAGETGTEQINGLQKRPQIGKSTAAPQMLLYNKFDQTSNERAEPKGLGNTHILQDPTPPLLLQPSALTGRWPRTLSLVRVPNQ